MIDQKNVVTRREKLHDCECEVYPYIWDLDEDLKYRKVP